MAKKKSNTKKSRVRKQPLPTFPNWVKWVLFTLGTVVYLPTVNYEYTQDDAIVIYDNMYTTQGIKGIPGLLSKDTFFGFFKEEGKSRLVSGGRYRPLTPLMFALEWQIFGQSPWIGHLINALLYGLIVMILFLVLKEILLGSHYAKKAFHISLIASILFALHPIHTEVVANIKGRDEMMSLLLSLGGLIMSYRWIKSGGWRTAFLSGVLFFLALLSKENAVTFFAIVPLTLYFFTRHVPKTILKSVIPVSLAIVIFLVIRGMVIGWSFGDTPQEMMNNPFIKIEEGQYIPFSFGEKSATITYTLGKYLQLLIYPHPLTHDYYPRHIPIMSWSKWQSILSLIGYILLIVLAVLGFRKKKISSFAILYFLITLSIVSNIVFPIGTNMSERFAFMPSVGFVLLLSGFLVWLKDWRKLNWKIIYVIVGIIGLLYLGKTFSRSAVWKNNFTLFTTDIVTSENSAKLLNAMGGELVAQSNREETDRAKQNLLVDAQGYLKRALDIHPNYKLSYLLMGNSLVYQDKFEEAVTYYEHTLRLDPNYNDGKKNLGIALREAGRVAGEQKGNPQLALEFFNKSEQYSPNDEELLRLTGVAYGRLGDHPTALTYFQRELAVNPNSANAYFNLGITYQNLGETNKAQEYFRKAREIDPGIIDRNLK